MICKQLLTCSNRHALFDKESTMVSSEFVATVPNLPKATQIQCEKEDGKLAFRLTIPKYNMAKPKPK